MGGDGEAHKNPTYLHHLLLLTPDNDKTHFEKGLVCSAISLFSDIGRTCTRLITILLDLSITWGGVGESAVDLLSEVCFILWRHLFIRSQTMQIC